MLVGVIDWTRSMGKGSRGGDSTKKKVGGRPGIAP